MRPDDLESLLEHIQAGFDSYAEFAPDGWEPPQVFEDRGRTAAMLADPETWALLAVSDARSLGHIAFMPAHLSTVNDSPSAWRFAPKIPGLVHLWHLFVRPERWGTGVAPALHESAVSEMSKRGFSTARLFTPSLHVRARRFYERRGWCVTDEAFNDGLELMLTEYRLTLSHGDIRPPASPDPPEEAGRRVRGGAQPLNVRRGTKSGWGTGDRRQKRGL